MDTVADADLKSDEKMTRCRQLQGIVVCGCRKREPLTLQVCPEYRLGKGDNS